MDKFPFEVLDNIFTRLHFRNKLKCMRVCRHWAKAIREGSLLHSASIIELENIKADALFSLLEEEPWRRKQVKRLVFGYSRRPYARDDFRADLLVNLKFLYLSREKGVYSHYIEHLPRESVAPFMNNIEHVEDLAGSEFIYQLLTTGTCPRLTTLVLWLIDYDDVDDIYQSIYEGDDDIAAKVRDYNQRLNKRIISHLFNAPALRKLDFSSFDFQISDFEVIHASLPQLESLTINYGTLHGDELPDDVIPTDSLKKLSLTQISTSSLSLSNMIRYVIKKYTCLQECIIDSYSGPFVQEIDANAFMTKFSKQLITLKLPIETGFVEWVCGFDCRLNSLTINKRNGIQSTLETLSRFSQRAFLTELTIAGLSNFDPAPLKELSHLNKLHISCLSMYEGAEIDIVSVLRSCTDHLTCLTLDWLTLKDVLPMSHTFALQELRFNSNSLPKQFDLFLSKCCPRLRSLTLSRCFSAGDHLNLPDLSLSYLKLALSYQTPREQSWGYFVRRPKTLFFVVTPKTELVYYVDGCNDIDVVGNINKEIDPLLYKTYFPIKSANLPKVKTATALYCRSVDTLIINDRIAC